MRIMMIQPNYHSGGAEIAGNWPPSWVPYVGWCPQTGRVHRHPVCGCHDQLHRAMPNWPKSSKDHQPDVVMATAITPMIYQSQTTLKIAKASVSRR
jgi:anaerobic magnesium-protoporphyrin IX monomethyl ester cyclase